MQHARGEPQLGGAARTCMHLAERQRPDRPGGTARVRWPAGRVSARAASTLSMQHTDGPVLRGAWPRAVWATWRPSPPASAFLLIVSLLGHCLLEIERKTRPPAFRCV